MTEPMNDPPIEIPLICDVNGDVRFHLIRAGHPGIKYCSVETHHNPGQTLMLIIENGRVMLK